MRLSVVTVNWNTTRLLQALLDSLRRYRPPFDCEVIVVDNASSDFEPASFSAANPDVKVIANEVNAGYAAGNNQGISESSGDYVLLANPDTEVTEGALEKLVEFMEAHPRAAAAGGKLVRPEGTLERSVRSFPYPGAIAWEFVGLARLFPKSRLFGRYRMTWFTYEQEGEVDQPMGSCLILSRKALEDVGTFDEQFPIFFNEADLLYRAKQKGYGVYFTPEATLVHHGAASTSQVDRREMVRESHESLMRFYRKHFKGRVFAPAYYFTVACISLGRHIRQWT